MSGTPHASHNMHPNSLANFELGRFRSGAEWKGNAGGNYRGTPKISNALAYLLSLDDDAFAAYKTKNKADKLAYKLIKDAETSDDIKDLVAAFKEIADRTEGKALQTKVVEHKVSAEVQASIVFEAYAHYYRSANREALHQALDAILDGFQRGDEPAARLALRAAMDEEEAAIDSVWEAATEAVTGSKG